MPSPSAVSYLIVGAGPAGLQMARHMSQAGCDFVVIEAGSGPGGFFEVYPRHGTLLSINRRHNLFPEPDFNLRHDWNSLLSDDPALLFRNYSQELFPDKEDLVRYLRDFAAPLEAHIRYDTRVEQIARHPDGGFAVTVTGGEVYHAAQVLMATGAVAPYLPPEIEGIEQAESYEGHSLDPADYEGQTVAIIGGGNSAFEVANHLAGHAAVIHLLLREPVRHAWSTHFPGDLRAVNNNVLDMYQLKSLHATIGFTVKSVSPADGGGFDVVLEGEQPHWDPPATATFPMRYHHVIRCTGWRYVDPSLFAPDCTPEVDAQGKYPVLSSAWESSVPGLYFLGTAMAARDRTAATPFIHGFRYNVRTLFHLLRERHDGVSLPRQELSVKAPEDVVALAFQLIHRMSTAGSLYQQFGVLGDAVVLNGDRAEWYQALPMDHLWDRPDLCGGELVTATLEYGFKKYPVTLQSMDVTKPHDPDNPSCSAFLHPVFRHYSGGQLTEELHFGESLLIRYDLESLTQPVDPAAGTNPYLRLLANFLGRKLGSGEAPLDEPLYPPELLHWTITPWSDEQREAFRPRIPVGAQPASECTFVF